MKVSTLKKVCFYGWQNNVPEKMVVRELRWSFPCREELLLIPGLPDTHFLPFQRCILLSFHPLFAVFVDFFSQR